MPPGRLAALECCFCGSRAEGGGRGEKEPSPQVSRGEGSVAFLSWQHLEGGRGDESDIIGHGVDNN